MTKTIFIKKHGFVRISDSQGILLPAVVEAEQEVLRLLVDALTHALDWKEVPLPLQKGTRYASIDFPCGLRLVARAYVGAHVLEGQVELFFPTSLTSADGAAQLQSELEWAVRTMAEIEDALEAAGFEEVRLVPGVRAPA